MPLTKEQEARYPGGSLRSPEWQAIRKAVGERSGWRCEGSPKFPDCGAHHGGFHPVTGSHVVLTVAHLHDDDHATLDITRLAHMCQRCHLVYDLPKHIANAAETRRRKSPQGDLFSPKIPVDAEAVSGL